MHGAATAWLRLADEQPALLPERCVASSSQWSRAVLTPCRFRAVRGAAALRDAAEELVRVAPVDGVAALRLLADLRRRFRAVTAQLEVAQAYASSHGGEAGVFAAEAGAERAAVQEPAVSNGVVVPRLDHAAAYE